MKLIGNLIWIILTGFASALMYLFLGIIWCITIIGIPFGLQAFKLARLSFAPFGAKVNTNFGKHPIANIIWFIFGGFGLTLAYLFSGLFYCITIIGIPFGLQAFKLAKLAFSPFGAQIN